MPLEMPEVDQENIMKKGKSSQEGLPAVVPGDYGNLHDSSFKNLVVVSNSPFISSARVSRCLNFGSFPV
jgi:hypothetical protein